MHVPKRIGRYNVVEVLGRGAHGEVFRATLDGPMGFRKNVAIKRVRGDAVADNPQLENSLLREARLGGLLKHVNIAETYELEQIDGDWCIAMEFVDGMLLSELVERLRLTGAHLPMSAVLEIGEQICNGLEHAHTLRDSDGRPQSIIHRDLKPGNAMLSAYGVVKILDFGIAKVADSDACITRKGQTKGSPAYMSPEQVEGEVDLDIRSDIFSLGSLIYELATARQLFEADDIISTMFEVVRSKTGPKLAMLNQQCPGLGNLLGRALHKDRLARFASAGELGRGLKRLREDLSSKVDLPDLARICVRADRNFLGSRRARSELRLFGDTFMDPRYGQWIGRERAAAGSELTSSSPALTAQKHRDHERGLHPLASSTETLADSPVAEAPAAQAPAEQLWQQPGPPARQAWGASKRPASLGAAAAKHPPLSGRLPMNLIAPTPTAGKPALWAVGAAVTVLTIATVTLFTTRPDHALALSEAQADVDLGSIVVLSIPAADIYLNGAHVGKTPYVGDVPTGKHRVKLVCDECATGSNYNLRFDLGAGSTKNIHHEFD